MTATTQTREAVAPRWLSIAAAAAYSGLSVSTIRAWLREGRLRPHRPSRRVLVDREQLDGLIMASAG